MKRRDPSPRRVVPGLPSLLGICIARQWRRSPSSDGASTRLCRSAFLALSVRLFVHGQSGRLGRRPSWPSPKCDPGVDPVTLELGFSKWPAGWRFTIERRCFCGRNSLVLAYLARQWPHFSTSSRPRRRGRRSRSTANAIRAGFLLTETESQSNLFW